MSIVERRLAREFIRPALLLLMAVIITGCYGEKLEYNGGELYFTDAVSKQEAERLGEFFVDQRFFDGNSRTVQLAKSGSTYQVRMVVKKGIDNDEKAIEILRDLATLISRRVFAGEDVEIHLCDGMLRTLRVVVDFQ